MPLRYYLDRYGATTNRLLGPPGRGHYAIAREVMRQQGVEIVADATGSDHAGAYETMFRLRYLRVVETEREVEYESRRKLTPDQRRFLADKQREGKRVTKIGSADRPGAVHGGHVR